jgi:hypothetical protein
VLRDLDVTPNQVWRLAKTDDEWSAALEAALTATRRDDLQHGTNAAYVQGCICAECREHQRIRMARSPLGSSELSVVRATSVRAASISREHDPQPIVIEVFEAMG